MDGFLEKLIKRTIKVIKQFISFSQKYAGNNPDHSRRYTIFDIKTANIVV